MPISATIEQKKKPSRFAYIVSFACAVHCLSTPLVVIFLPFLGHIFHNHFIEIGLLAFSIMVGIWIIYNGYCHHKKQHSVVLFSTGVSFWLIHIFSDLLHSHSSDTVFVIAGALFVVGSYYLNHKFLKCCDHNHDHNHDTKHSH
ncbi:MerC domain-containing protein [bacterium]|jgi:hypothetical protein|nr:MerC domain-containing protein [bacterium]